MLALGRLLRISLFPSAFADVAAGIVLGTRGAGLPPGTVALLVLASLGVYHGGMALNDWVDREGDLGTRPERPIPSGAIPAPAALAIAVGLLVGGVLCAALVTPRAGSWMGGVALCAALYDLVGRGPWLGPALLGTCRAGNFALGVLAPTWIAGEAWPADSMLLAPCVLYGAYVLAISRLGRLEDDEDTRPLGRRPALALGAAAICMAAIPLCGVLLRANGVGALGIGAAAVLALAGAKGLFMLARKRDWERSDVGRAMGVALRRLLVFTAACSVLFLWSQAAALVALAILAGYPVSFLLRRACPPT